MSLQLATEDETWTEGVSILSLATMGSAIDVYCSATVYSPKETDMSQIKITDIAGQGIPYVPVRFSVDHQISAQASYDALSKVDGTQGWPIPGWPVRDYTLHVNTGDFADPTYSSESRYIPAPANGNYGDELFVLTRMPLERIELDGYFARTTDTHTPFFFKGESAFLDLFRLLRGEDLSPLLRQSQALGSNGRRNFLCSWNTAKQATGDAFDPRRYGQDFFDAIPALLDQYASHGLWLYASVFPDNGYWPDWTLNQKFDHWFATCEALKQRPNSFAVELTNEPNGHAENDVDARQFPQPSGILSCSGSRGDTGSDPMPDPQWSFCDHHNQRSYPKCVTDISTANHPSRQWRQKAMLEGEPLGFGDPRFNPNRSADPRLAREMAGTARGTNIGVIFHSQHGGFSQPYDDIEMACARAWFAELR